MAEPTIKPQIISRVVTHDVMTGAAVKLVRDGTVVDGVTVSNASYPDPDQVPEAWVSLGFGGGFDLTPDEKVIETEQVLDDGRIAKHKESLLLGMTLNFQSTQMSPEAYELMTGAKGPLDDGKETQLAARSSNMIEGWLIINVMRSQDQAAKLKPIIAHGKLHLKTPPKGGTSDYAKPEWEFIVDMAAGELNTVTPANIQQLKQADAA